MPSGPSHGFPWLLPLLNDQPSIALLGAPLRKLLESVGVGRPLACPLTVSLGTVMGMIAVAFASAMTSGAGRSGDCEGPVYWKSVATSRMWLEPRELEEREERGERDERRIQEAEAEAAVAELRVLPFFSATLWRLTLG